ncbi:MAG: hypothetical protein V4812_21585 [Pseudomonadota bacterium]
MRTLKLCIYLICSALVTGCAQQYSAHSNADIAAENSVSAYLSGAEIQAEDNAQRSELIKAFEEMLALPVADLKTRRYAGYDGTQDARSLVDLLRDHIVPAKPQAIDPTQFFISVKSPVAQTAIRMKLDELK